MYSDVYDIYIIYMRYGLYWCHMAWDSYTLASYIYCMIYIYIYHIIYRIYIYIYIYTYIPVDNRDLREISLFYGIKIQNMSIQPEL